MAGTPPLPYDSRPRSLLYWTHLLFVEEPFEERTNLIAAGHVVRIASREGNRNVGGAEVLVVVLFHGRNHPTDFGVLLDLIVDLTMYVACGFAQVLGG